MRRRTAQEENFLPLQSVFPAEKILFLPAELTATKRLFLVQYSLIFLPFQKLI